MNPHINNNRKIDHELNNPKVYLKFILFSLIGIFMFFIPISINGVSTIPLDHIVTDIKENYPYFTSIYTVIIITLGGLYPLYKKTWNKDRTTTVFSVFKIIGIFIGFCAVSNFGPEWLFAPDVLPFTFYKIVIPIGLIIPVGSVFLSFLISYGLLEFVGIL
ncbi:MAG: hypothetical protein AB2417_00750 [Clostridiaceae bacterium]